LRSHFKRPLAPSIATLAVLVGLITLSPSVLAAQNGRVTDRQLAAMQATVSTNRDVFGGLVVNDSQGIVTIYIANRVNPSRKQQALSAIAADATAKATSVEQGRWSVRYVSRDPSLAVLDGVLAKVTALSWSTDVAAHWISFGIDPRRGTVSVGVDAITPLLASDTLSTFDSLVTLRTMERPKRFSRMADSQPWWGGDRIYDSGLWGNVQCTAGFPAYRNSDGHRGMLTAGHCFSNGENAKQGYCTGTFSCNYYGNMGNVASYSYCNWCLDGEWLDSQAAGSSVQFDVYTTGGQWGQGSATVYGWGQSSVGLGVCLDGSFTTENCGATVVNQLEQCVNIEGQVTCNLTETNSSSRACQGGDSGGPVYRYWGTQAIGAYGLIDAGNAAGTDCLYTEIGDAMNVLGVTIIAY